MKSKKYQGSINNKSRISFPKLPAILALLLLLVFGLVTSTFASFTTAISNNDNSNVSSVITSVRNGKAIADSGRNVDYATTGWFTASSTYPVYFDTTKVYDTWGLSSRNLYLKLFYGNNQSSSNVYKMTKDTNNNRLYYCNDSKSQTNISGIQFFAGSNSGDYKNGISQINFNGWDNALDSPERMCYYTDNTSSWTGSYKISPPPPSKISLGNDDSTTCFGGTGTSTDPYLVAPGVKIKVKASVTLQTDGTGYQTAFSIDETSYSNYSGETSYEVTSSASSGNIYTAKAKSKGDFNSSSSNSEVFSNTVYYKCQQNTFTVTCPSSGTGWTNVTGTGSKTQGANIDVSLTLSSGYMLTTQTTVKDANNNNIRYSLSDTNNKTITFTMPGSNVTISPVCQKIVQSWGLIGKSDNDSSYPFTVVNGNNEKLSWDQNNPTYFDEDGNITLRLKSHNYYEHNQNGYGFTVYKDGWFKAVEGSSGYRKSTSTTYPNPKTLSTSYTSNMGIDATDYPGEYILHLDISSTSNPKLQVYYPCKITFNMRGHGTGVSSQIVKYNTSFTRPTDPTCTGYTFDDWYTDTNYTTKYDFNKHATSDETVYAKWIPLTTDVTLNPNDGSTGTFPIVSATFDAAMPTLTTLPTRVGYTFTGYYDDISSGKQYYTNSGISKANWDKTDASAILYAHWTANVYTLSFDLNYQGHPTNPDDKTVTYDQTYQGKLPEVSRNHYNFDGWFTSSTGGVKINSSDIVKITSDSTLYAHWTPINYKVNFVVFPTNSGSTNPSVQQIIPYGSYVEIDANPKTGYSFYKWTIDDGYGSGGFGTFDNEQTECEIKSIRFYPYEDTTLTANFVLSTTELIINESDAVTPTNPNKGNIKINNTALPTGTTSTSINSNETLPLDITAPSGYFINSISIELVEPSSTDTARITKDEQKSSPDHWVGTIIISNSARLSISYTKPKIIVTNDDNEGTIKINSVQTNEAFVDYGITSRLTIIPNHGNKFSTSSSDSSLNNKSNNAEITYTSSVMGTNNVTVTVTYSLITYNISAQAYYRSSSSLYKSRLTSADFTSHLDYSADESRLITAKTINGYSFKGWVDTYSQSPPSFTCDTQEYYIAVDGDRTYYPMYTKNTSIGSLTLGTESITYEGSTTASATASYGDGTYTYKLYVDDIYRDKTSNNGMFTLTANQDGLTPGNHSVKIGVVSDICPEVYTTAKSLEVLNETGNFGIELIKKGNKNFDGEGTEVSPWRVYLNENYSLKFTADSDYTSYQCEFNYDGNWRQASAGILETGTQNPIDTSVVSSDKKSVTIKFRYKYNDVYSSEQTKVIYYRVISTFSVSEIQKIYMLNQEDHLDGYIDDSGSNYIAKLFKSNTNISSSYPSTADATQEFTVIQSKLTARFDLQTYFNTKGPKFFRIDFFNDNENIGSTLSHTFVGINENVSDKVIYFKAPSSATFVNNSNYRLMACTNSNLWSTMQQVGTSNYYRCSVPGNSTNIIFMIMNSDKFDYRSDEQTTEACFAWSFNFTDFQDMLNSDRIVFEPTSITGSTSSKVGVISGDSSCWKLFSLD